MMNLLNARQSIRKEREFIELSSNEQINGLINQYLQDARLRIHEYPTDIVADMETNHSDGNVHITLNKPLPSGFDIYNYLSLYTMNKRYIEIILKKDLFNGQAGVFKLMKAKIAKDYRRIMRFNVEDEHYRAENFHLSRHYIGPGMKELPDIARSAFNSLKPKTVKDYKRIDFIPFNNMNLTTELLAAYDSKKNIYIEDTGNIFHNGFQHNDFLDYPSYLGKQLEQEMALLRANRIQSLFVVPVSYQNLANETTVIGFLKVVSHSKSIANASFDHYFRMVKKLNSLIQEMNLKKIKTTAKIANISQTGIQIHVDDDELAESIASNPEELIFDLTVNSTLKFNFSGKAMNMFTNPGNGFNIGITITGSGSRLLGLNDWLHYIDKLV